MSNGTLPCVIYHQYILCLFFICLKQKEKAVVTPDWLRDSAKAGKPMPCGDYVALHDLHDTSVINCPDSESCTGCDKCRTSSDANQSIETSVVLQEHDEKHETYIIETEQSMLPTSSNLSHIAHYAVERASPLVCLNQDLVKELSIIRKSRELEGEDRSALSYQRAIGVSHSLVQICLL